MPVSFGASSLPLASTQRVVTFLSATVLWSLVPPSELSTRPVITADSKNATAASLTPFVLNNCVRIAEAPSEYIFSYAFNNGWISVSSDNLAISAFGAFTLVL